MTQAVAGRKAPTRVRLELQESASLAITLEDYAPVPAHGWTYAIGQARVSSADALARYKTSWRTLIDSEFARLRAVTGCDQVLFLNERNELAEGNYTNVFLRRDGRLLTPPLSSGALDGVLRRALLDSGECEEAVLTVADLAAGELYFGNSLRGLIPATPVAAQASNDDAVRSSM
jgi:branched-subunit amino acid aminotransferase/4-amino-4-deoxychorismate lyase